MSNASAARLLLSMSKKHSMKIDTIKNAKMKMNPCRKLPVWNVSSLMQRKSPKHLPTIKGPIQLPLCPKGQG
ncbi:hypothetical protein BC936DRAFT_147990 [Jimgerdemannia flammicorona]|uniref:Uncharacterized protein n=1 Tax=Jimgerdemannia flammicorona TaxID=994334 RepID=A0A433D410_9FUNG|nr:hypothetical protein BC936DRAFT_147990 [Jimgerdemannia flammicorona]